MNTENTEAKDTEQTSAKKHSWKYDIILLAVLAVIGLAIFIAFQIKGKRAANPDSGEPVYFVQVDVNNRTEALIPTNADGDYTFDNIYAHSENIVTIKDGSVYMKSSTCDNQVCVNQGTIEPGTVIPIVCMPNVVYVSIVEQSEIDFSAVREEIVPDELKDAYEAYRESVASGK